MEEREEILNLYEPEEEDWIQYLREFDEKVWPIFKRRGYTKDAAFLGWKLQAVLNEVKDLVNPPHTDPF